MATRKAHHKGSKKARKGTRKGKRAPSAWNKLVMKVYKEMKAKDKNVKFGDALKAAAKRHANLDLIKVKDLRLDVSSDGLHAFGRANSQALWDRINETITAATR